MLKSIFTRFNNLVQALYADEGLRDGFELDALLSRIHWHLDREESVCIAELVRTNAFGSSPTVLKRLRIMQQMGWIRQTPSRDGRKKSWMLTPLGLQRLEHREQMLRSLLGGSEPTG